MSGGRDRSERFTSWGTPLPPVATSEDVSPRDLEQAADAAAFRDEKTREYRALFANPYVAAERGYVDEVIMPRDTRARLCAALELLRTKRDSNPPRKHGNIPL